MIIIVFLSSSWRKAITLPPYHMTSYVDNNLCVVCAHTQNIKYQSIIDVLSMKTLFCWCFLPRRKKAPTTIRFDELKIVY